MNSIKVFFCLLFISSLSIAQEKTDNIITGIANTDVTLGSEFVFGCELKIEELLKAQTEVYLYGVEKCSKGREVFYKVVYNGNSYLANEKQIDVLPKDETYLWSLDSISSSKIRNSFIQASKEKYEYNKKITALFLEEGKSAGILIKEASIYDESEYTDGTGFKVTFTNPTSKTIKYITFTITGINRVNDIVSSKTMKGVGPILPKSEGEYSFRYLWNNDLIYSFKIPSVKIQYTDGTFKTIHNAEKLIISESRYNSLYSK